MSKRRFIQKTIGALDPGDKFVFGVGPDLTPDWAAAEMGWLFTLVRHQSKKVAIVIGSSGNKGPCDADRVCYKIA